MPTEEQRTPSDNCKGCAMLELMSSCYILNVVKKGFLTNFCCPCSDCVVKVMCRLSCEKANNYFEKVNKLVERAKGERKKTIDEEVLRQWTKYSYKTENTLRG